MKDTFIELSNLVISIQVLKKMYQQFDYNMQSVHTFGSYNKIDNKKKIAFAVNIFNLSMRRATYHLLQIADLITSLVSSLEFLYWKVKHNIIWIFDFKQIMKLVRYFMHYTQGDHLQYQTISKLSMQNKMRSKMEHWNT